MPTKDGTPCGWDNKGKSMRMRRLACFLEKFKKKKKERRKKEEKRRRNKVVGGSSGLSLYTALQLSVTDMFRRQGAKCEQLAGTSTRTQSSFERMGKRRGWGRRGGEKGRKRNEEDNRQNEATPRLTERGHTASAHWYALTILTVGIGDVDSPINAARASRSSFPLREVGDATPVDGVGADISKYHQQSYSSNAHVNGNVLVSAGSDN